MEVKRVVASVKLDELIKQHDRLTKHYADLLKSEAEQATTIGKLRVLFDGLKQLKFSNEKLHPEIVNFEAVLQELEHKSNDEALAKTWLERLELEVKYGTRRSDVAYLFGSLLNESVRDAGMFRQSSGPAEGMQNAEREHLKWLKGLVESCSSSEFSFLDEFFAKEGAEPFEELCKELVPATLKPLTVPVKTPWLKGLLRRNARDIYVAPEKRKIMSEMLGDNQACKEFADVITIMLQDIENWNWPSGVPVMSMFTRHKWRTFLSPDIITRIFLEVVGVRIMTMLRNRLLTAHPWRKEISKPGQNVWPNIERNRLNAWSSFYLHEMNEIMPAAYGSEIVGTGEDPYLVCWGGQVKVVQAIRSEVAVARAAELPFWALRTDIALFFPSLRHDVILHVCRKLGFPDVWINFFKRFLKVPMAFPVEVDGQETVVKCAVGIPMDLALSKVFCELVMYVMDIYVYKRSKCMLYRQVDDIFVFSDSQEAIVSGWKSIQEFAAGTYLGLNMDKSGVAAVGVSGPVPPELPKGQPSFCMLKLQNSGDWSIDVEQLTKIENHLRERLLACNSVFRMVEIYNSFAKYLIRMCCPTVFWAPDHIQTISEAASKWHFHLFGQGRGIVEEVKLTISKRFLCKSNASDAEIEAAAEKLPNAWLFFPATSGGLGLYSIPARMAALRHKSAPYYEQAHAAIVPKVRDDDWLSKSREWGQYYNTMGNLMSENKPNQSPLLKQLIADFVSRGSEVSGGHQSGLSAYWQWVVFTYGPSVTETFGSFRFLDTEVVPMSIIKLQRVDNPF